MLVLSIKMQRLLFTAKLPSGGRILAERWSDRISRGERGCCESKREREREKRAIFRGRLELEECGVCQIAMTTTLEQPSASSLSLTLRFSRSENMTRWTMMTSELASPQPPHLRDEMKYRFLTPKTSWRASGDTAAAQRPTLIRYKPQIASVGRS